MHWTFNDTEPLITLRCVLSRGVHLVGFESWW